MLHLQASELDLDDGAAVTSWESKAPATVSASQATPSQAPVYVANAVNGEPAVRFDGVDDGLLLSSNLFAAAGLNKTVFAVTASTDFLAHVIGASPADANDLTSRGYGLGIAAGKPFFKANDFGGPFVLAPNEPVDMQPSSVGVRISPSAVELTAGCSVTSAESPSPATFTESYIGGVNITTETFAGDIPELVVYNRVLTDQEFLAVRSYLAERYGAYAAPIVDTDADGILDACDTDASYLGSSEISVTLQDPAFLTDGDIANFTDADSATVFDPHTSATHIWVSGGAIVARLDFDVAYDVEQVHFWNFNGEDYDVDTLTLDFYDAADQLIEQVVLTPQKSFEEILAEDFLVNVNGVSYVIMTAVGDNNESEFQNIGFSATPAQ